MRFGGPEGEDAQRCVRSSVSELAEHYPELSAVRVLTRPQRNSLLLVIAAVVVGAVLAPVVTAMIIVGVATLVYTVGIIHRIVLFSRSQDKAHVEFISDEEARAVPDSDLPRYTVLVPAYREPAVIGALLGSILRLEYPRHLLEVMILLEADDHETISAISGADGGDFVEAVVVPVAEPRTKPKALNYGLSLAGGEVLTVYDAEDRPDPLQLRRAAVALRRLGDQVACVQAKLSYYNSDQNLITRWFTLEYAMWFSWLLPGLVAGGAPLPLGGTSNHFRRSALEAVGAWDPFNVTEDADLGIRLHRSGYLVRMLDSVTLEEANSDFVNWVKQRSRWYKGYLQTLLVHLRNPRQLRREVGLKGMMEFVVLVGSTPLLALLNPVFWTLTTIWFVSQPHFIKAVFPAPIFYVSILCWGFGNFAIAYMTVVTARLEDRCDLLWAALSVPLYWVMMSIAAVKATVQLIFTPSFWEKTVHGLQGDGVARGASPSPSPDGAPPVLHR